MENLNGPEKRLGTAPSVHSTTLSGRPPPGTLKHHANARVKSRILVKAYHLESLNDEDKSTLLIAQIANKGNETQKVKKKLQSTLNSVYHYDYITQSRLLLKYHSISFPFPKFSTHSLTARTRLPSPSPPSPSHPTSSYTSHSQSDNSRLSP